MLLIYSILDKNTKLNKCRKDFIAEIFWLFLSIRGRINFLQFGHFGNHSEQRYRQQFEKPFDFLAFNKDMLSSSTGKTFVIAFDPTYIPKSGKATPGLGRFWSGSAGEAKWGLEIGGIAAIDIENNTGFHLEAIQTPNGKSLEENSLTLLNWYANIITERAQSLSTISKYLVADAYFAKKSFTDAIVKSGMHLVSRLRDDADLKYIYSGKATGKKGRPKKFAGKIDFSNIDKKYFTLINSDTDSNTYSAIVHSKSLKRDIKIVYVEQTDKSKKKSHKIYFSTNLELEAKSILLYYHSRFQIEFIYRDAKQYTGLNDCQARDEKKLYFHFNLSLSSVNIAKIVHWVSIPKEERKAFSMNDIKIMNHNALMLERFICVFAIKPNKLKNANIVKELLYLGTMAA